MKRCRLGIRVALHYCIFYDTYLMEEPPVVTESVHAQAQRELSESCVQNLICIKSHTYASVSHWHVSLLLIDILSTTLRAMRPAKHRHMYPLTCIAGQLRLLMPITPPNGTHVSTKYVVLSAIACMWQQLTGICLQAKPTISNLFGSNL